MTFNPKSDKIAITIPKFTLKENADKGLFMSKYNEPYILSMAIDSQGKANPQIDFNFMPFPKICAKQTVEMLGDGHLLYGPKNPGEFVALSILIMESDADIRKAGEFAEKAVKSEAVKLGLKALIATNPGAGAILGILKEVIQFVAGRLKNNGDDELFRYEGSFLRNLPNPYHINRRYTGSNDFVEVAVQIIPLKQENGQGASVKEIKL